MTSELNAALEAAVAFHEELRVWCVRLDEPLCASSERLAAPWAHFVRGIREHLDVEERVLFPAIRALLTSGEPEGDAFLGPLRAMQHEADELETISGALRNASIEAGEHEADLLALLDKLDRHARMESDVVFPAAAALYASWRGHLLTPAPAPHARPDRHEAEPGGRMFALLRRFRRS